MLDNLPPSLQAHGSIRVDLQFIADLIRPASRVLDIGCGDGALLEYLVNFKQVDGRGIELSQAGVNACVSHGLSVIQGDANTDLATYPSDAFDYVVLSQTLQATQEPARILADLVRIGRAAIVSFPNFGHWRVRWQLLMRGRMPHTAALGHDWYSTPNIHLCTITDFVDLARAQDTVIEHAAILGPRGRTLPDWAAGRLGNLLGEQAVFVLRRRDKHRD